MPTIFCVDSNSRITVLDDVTVGDDVKKNVQEKIDALKAARAGTDASAIKSAADALSSAMSAIGEAMAKSQGQQGEAGSQQNPEQGPQQSGPTGPSQ